MLAHSTREPYIPTSGLGDEELKESTIAWRTLAELLHSITDGKESDDGSGTYISNLTPNWPHSPPINAAEGYPTLPQVKLYNIQHCCPLAEDHTAERMANQHSEVNPIPARTEQACTVGTSCLQMGEVRQWL